MVASTTTSARLARLHAITPATRVASVEDAAERMVVLVVTRPLPLLAETTAIVAGTTRALSVPRVALWAAVGALAPAVAYAVAGASAAGGANLPLVFAAVVALAGATWLVGRGGVTER